MHVIQRRCDVAEGDDVDVVDFFILEGELNVAVPPVEVLSRVCDGRARGFLQGLKVQLLAIEELLRKIAVYCVSSTNCCE
jgi:hypothetical protein